MSDTRYFMLDQPLTLLGVHRPLFCSRFGFSPHHPRLRRREHCPHIRLPFTIFDVSMQLDSFPSQTPTPSAPIIMKQRTLFSS